MRGAGKRKISSEFHWSRLLWLSGKHMGEVKWGTKLTHVKIFLAKWGLPLV